MQKNRIVPWTATSGAGDPTPDHAPRTVLCAWAALGIARQERPQNNFQPAQSQACHDAALPDETPFPMGSGWWGHDALVPPRRPASDGLPASLPCLPSR